MTIDQLPPETLTHVLSCLHVNDLLRCRLVCRKWRSNIENNVRISDLMVREQEEDREQFFVFTPRLVESSHQFVADNPNFSGCQIMQILLRHLKKLSIDRLNSAFDLEHLANLECLQVQELTLNTPNRLRSTSLKTLAVLRNCGEQLRLDTPNLLMFEFEMGLDRFEFAHPESVSHLAATSFRQEFRQFRNLQIFFIGCSCIRGFFSTEIPSEILKTFPALRELHCSLINSNVLLDILADKNDLKRTKFRFYLRGLPINTINELNGYVDQNGIFLDFDLNSNFHHILENYPDLASPLPFIRSVNYSSLNRHFNGQFEKGFFHKFINIRRLVVNELIYDERQFVWFVKNCKWLEEFEVNADLSQSIYDWLPTYRPQINRLTIYQEQVLDFSFVFDFEELVFFKTTQEVSFVFAANLIRQFGRLMCIRFKHNDNPIEILSKNHKIRSSRCLKSFRSKSYLLQFLSSDAAANWPP